MQTPQEVRDRLADPIAQELLHAAIPTRLAYSWHDGTPRVVPIWFHWTGEELVISGPPDAPKVDAIREHRDVALTIDRNEWPYHVLLIRGTAAVTTVDGVAAEYAQAAERYFGAEQGRQWVAMVASMLDQTARIAIQPTHVEILDFESRFPSRIAARMG